jgi:nucleoside phosphorylase
MHSLWNPQHPRDLRCRVTRELALLGGILDEEEALRADTGVLVVFAALKVEISPLKAILSRCERVSGDRVAYIGQLAGQSVMIASCGVGQERALAAAASVHSGYDPRGVLSAGFCAGLVPELRPSDLVLSSWLIRASEESVRGPKRLSLGEQASRLETSLEARGIRARTGGFVCVSRPVISPDEKRSLAQRTKAMIAEMETFHLGDFFMARKVSFMGIRAVLDCVDDYLPLQRRTAETGKVPGVLKALTNGLCQRGELSRLWRIYKNGRSAQIALGKGVAAVIGVWPWEGRNGHFPVSTR